VHRQDVGTYLNKVNHEKLEKKDALQSKVFAAIQHPSELISAKDLVQEKAPATKEEVQTLRAKVVAGIEQAKSLLSSKAKDVKDAVVEDKAPATPVLIPSDAVADAAAALPAQRPAGYTGRFSSIINLFVFLAAFTLAYSQRAYSKFASTSRGEKLITKAQDTVHAVDERFHVQDKAMATMEGAKKRAVLLDNRIAETRLKGLKGYGERVVIYAQDIAGRIQDRAVAINA